MLQKNFCHNAQMQFLRMWTVHGLRRREGARDSPILLFLTHIPSPEGSRRCLSVALAAAPAAMLWARDVNSHKVKNKEPWKKSLNPLGFISSNPKQLLQPVECMTLQVVVSMAEKWGHWTEGTEQAQRTAKLPEDNMLASVETASNYGHCLPGLFYLHF